MLRITDLKVPLGAGEKAPLLLALRLLGIAQGDVLFWRIAKKSVDARDKGAIMLIYALDISLRQDEQKLLAVRPLKNAAILPQIAPSLPARASCAQAPVVVGAGPCGLAAAYRLAQAGLCPIILERGEPVEQRARTVGRFWHDGTLDSDSNMQFGEGGAGAFSDGKLTTGIKDPLCRDILSLLVRFGAPEEIEYLANPHIGTDRLPQVVAAWRRSIEDLGGRFFYRAKLTAVDAKDGRLYQVRWQQENKETALRCDHVFLALGHSARDTLAMLAQAGLGMQQKPFSIGLRIEHPQALIDQAQYGAAFAHNDLPRAEYHLNMRTPQGRGVYTFCMCPGGKVVGAASEPGGLCVNGMSPYARNGPNANAALLADVRIEDYDRGHVLDGFAFQRNFEQLAFAAGGGKYRAVVQRLEDFLKNRPSQSIGAVQPTYLPGVVAGDAAALLPDFAASAIRQAIPAFARRLRGYDLPDALLTAVETRSSCPVRILRNALRQGTIGGIFPCGEGGGWAGGIMSAAVDGWRSAQALLDQLA